MGTRAGEPSTNRDRVGRIGRHGVLAVSLLGVVACRGEKPAPPAPATSPASAAPKPAPGVASAAPSASPGEPGYPHTELDRLVARWNTATIAADAETLKELYAPELGLYGHQMTRDAAARQKLDALKKSMGFTQSLGGVRYTRRPNDDQEASFDKTSGTPGKMRTVPAYLLLRKLDGAWHIVDEGDHVTDKVLRKQLAATSGTPRYFRCPECDEEDGAPEAEPPLGPAKSAAEGEPPPGAPKVVEYARLFAWRFASTADIPLFATVSRQSGNGDGRWFMIEAPGEAGKPVTLMDCAVGGFWFNGPQPGKPDFGHRDYPEITSTEVIKRDAEGLHYDKHLYAPDKIENYVLCTIAPEGKAYGTYLLSIAKHVGRSLRVASGGWYDRVQRNSQAY